MVPEIDYEELIEAAVRKNKAWAQGTNGCIAFARGAEWFRSQMLASARAIEAAATEPLLQRIAELERENEALRAQIGQCDMQIRVLFECVENGVTGTTSAPVKRVEWEDDGTLTAVLDYWPPPAPQQKPVVWQPIEVAPRDGTEILLMSDKGRVANGMWVAVNSAKGYWAWPYVNLEPAKWTQLPLLCKPPRQPLSASDIVTMYDENPRSDSEMIAFARAIEAAHNIGEKK